MKTIHPKTPPKKVRKITYKGVEQIMRSRGFTTQREFAEILGISEIQLGQILKDNPGSMTKAVQNKILNAFPDVNIQDILIEELVPA